MHKKRPKICTHYGVSAVKIYLYHSNKNTSSRPPLGLSSEYNSVQSFSGSWFSIVEEEEKFGQCKPQLVCFLPHFLRPILCF